MNLKSSHQHLTVHLKMTQLKCSTCQGKRESQTLYSIAGGFLRITSFRHIFCQLFLVFSRNALTVHFSGGTCFTWTVPDRIQFMDLFVFFKIFLIFYHKLIRSLPSQASCLSPEAIQSHYGKISLPCRWEPSMNCQSHENAAKTAGMLGGLL